MSGRAKKRRRAERLAVARSPERGPAEQEAESREREEIQPQRPPAGFKTWILALLLAALTVVAYQQAWNAGYIWDDDKYVTENPLLTAPDGLQRIWFSKDSPSQYFPLVYTTFRLEHAIWGLDPRGYHWVNILLHAANALLVWKLLRELRLPGAWFAAALFALHPVHVESVAWITERKNVLMGIFFLLALLAWLRFTAAEGARRWQFYGLALLLYALSLFSKTTACTMPAVLVLILWLKRVPITVGRLLHVVPFLVLGFGMGLLTVWWERNIQGTQGDLFAMSLAERLLVASRAVWFYASKLIWPAELAFSYPKWNISAADPADYIWMVAIAAAAAAIYFGRRFLGRSVEVATVYYVAMLSPMLGLIMLYTFRYTFVADHYQYLATVGPFALFAAAGAYAIRALRAEWQRYATALAAIVILLPLGLRTWQQCAIYKDEETLWRATIAVNPASWMAYNNLGIIQLRRGEFDEAAAQFRRALAIDPDYAEAHYNLANALVRKGAVGDAIAGYRKAIELNPKIVGAHVNLGRVLQQTGRVAEAVSHLQAAVAMSPRNDAARAGLGAALAATGRSAEAVEHLRAAALAAPQSTEIQNDLGNALLDLRRHDEAIAAFNTALAMDGSNPEAHFNLGNALRASSRLEEAAASYRRAADIRPDYAAARNNLANTLVQLGQLDAAIAEYQAAIAIRPNYAAAHKNLAIALQRLGRFDEAARHAQIASDLDAEAARGRR